MSASQLPWVSGDDRLNPNTFMMMTAFCKIHNSPEYETCKMNSQETNGRIRGTTRVTQASKKTIELVWTFDEER